MTYYVYMLRCNNGSFYTGYTNNLNRRLKEHRTGRGGKYTRSRLPVRLVYAEEHDSQYNALRREREVKKFTRKEKLALVKSQDYNKLADLILM